MNKQSFIIVCTAAVVGSVLLLIFAVGMAFAIGSKYERFRIPQNGMYPTLPAGSTHWVTKNSFESADEFSLGDIVVFKIQRSNKTYSYVWRVIALPGDEVSIELDQIKINGVLIDREFKVREGELAIFVETHGEEAYEVAYDSGAPAEDRVGCQLTVPDGQLFLLGDNRYVAADSRYHGPVPIADVLGKMHP